MYALLSIAIFVSCSLVPLCASDTFSIDCLEDFFDEFVCEERTAFTKKGPYFQAKVFNAAGQPIGTSKTVRIQ